MKAHEVQDSQGFRARQEGGAYGGIVVGGCEGEDMLLGIGIDKMVCYLPQLPVALVPDSGDVGVDCIQGLDTCVPILVAGKIVTDTMIWEKACSSLHSDG